MAFTFLYVAVRALLGALVRSRRGLHVKDVELLVLRHELEILRRQVARPKLTPSDRALLAAAAVNLPRSSRGMLLFTPRSLLRWHQALVRRKWRQPAGRRGRPKLPAEVRELVLRLARENPRWGVGFINSVVCLDLADFQALEVVNPRRGRSFEEERRPPHGARVRLSVASEGTDQGVP